MSELKNQEARNPAHLRGCNEGLHFYMKGKCVKCRAEMPDSQVGELKNQELPLEGVELYMQQAREFLANSAKMDDAPIPWMIAAAFKNEAENRRLRAELKAKDTELADERLVFEHANEVIGKLDADLDAARAELAAKDARIAELTGCKFSDRSHAALKARAEAAEKSLGAVAEVLKKYEPDLRDTIRQIRSIVEGNHAK